MYHRYNLVPRHGPTIIVLTFFITLIILGIPIMASQSNTQVPIQILGVNDIHGGLQTTGKLVMDQKSVTNAGGLARLGGYLDQTESDFKILNPKSVTMRVQAGDMVGASPANSALLDDGPTLASLKAMHIQVGILGNHEFDHGIDQYLKEVNGNAPSTQGIKNQQQVSAIKQYPFANTGMKLLAANVIDKQTHEIPNGYSAYTIKTIKNPNNHQTGKIGFIGILNTNLPGIAKKYDLLNEASTIAKYDKILRAKGVHAIIVLGHTGAVTQNGETTGDAVNDIYQLQKIDPDNSVDAFFAAHSHQYANGSIDGIPIMQAGFQGRAYSDLVGKFDFLTDDFVPDSLNPSVKPVYSTMDDPTSTFNHDKSFASITNIIKDANRRVAPIINTKVGSISDGQSISNDLSTTNESQAAYVVVDAQRAVANEQGHKTDIAITSNDSIRSGMDASANGDVTLGTLYNMQPYGNSQPIVELTGDQIIQLLNEQYTKSQLYFLQLSGLTYHYKSVNDGNQIATVSDVKVNDQPINPTTKYRVLTNDYLSTGGDGYTAFTKGTIVDNAGQDIDLLTDYMQTKSPIPTPQLNRKINS
ncbi:bifunctional metallophosphatase/5'-nucleotidase [Lentilactobacillus sp. SPB1-3]|uniref:Bifunctional UDP-sugar hydrolase/5'-nucleotidase n=1 Tax=Lentilactobacillus terminaliae TaxID=3003483 RepID=A0ACD5DE09_9LACO|nr:bifunctional metallophosphatase/5'-nucleotidase [Lentilactobacillus sp. SPB1-3]MCZ0977789.1 bifunctional metallophosphatase/5'-nucleotidase [Lentilactobacillus sp. SPB1-3]